MIEDHVEVTRLVVGVRKHSPVGKVVLGSIPQRLILDATVPVPSVKAEHAEARAAQNPTLVQPVDIATIGSSTPVTRSLSEHLENMFVELMSDAPTSGRTMQLECRYEYRVQADLEPVSVPLMFVPPMHFVLERDGMVPEGGCPSNALGEIAGTITGWFNTHPSPSADGRLRVDIVVFSRSTPPLPVRLRSFTLALHYIAPRLTTTG